MDSGKAANQASGLPVGLEVARLVMLPIMGKTIEIRRWSYSRLMMVSRLLNDLNQGLPADQADDANAALTYFFEHGSKQFFQIVRLTVVPEQRELISEEMDAADAMLLIDAVFDLNKAADQVKKATGLAGEFFVGKAVGKATKKGEAVPTTTATT